MHLPLQHNSKDRLLNNFPRAPLEVATYFLVVSSAACLHITGALSQNGAIVITAGLLFAIVVRAWSTFDGGRHPAFLFLCSLALFQGGRLFGYCLGLCEHPLRIELMTAMPFNPSPQTQAVVMLMILTSAITIYAPPSFWYRWSPAVHKGISDDVLQYLHLVFWLTIPVQLLKNFSYFQYARSNGGYLVYFMDHAGLAASVPFWVRAVSLITMPTFVAIFALEISKRRLCLTATAYFLSSALILMIGSRGPLFGLILSLWFIASRKSNKPIRAFKPVLLLMTLVIVGAVIGLARRDDNTKAIELAPLHLLVEQGSSMSVTEVAVEYRRQFALHQTSYLSHELLSAFIPADQGSYRPGKSFASDVAVLLNSKAFDVGFGSGSAYLAEAYVVGGFGFAIGVSLAIGAFMHILSRIAGSAIGLALVGVLLPDLLWMPRAGLLNWVSASLRNAIVVSALLVGWKLYRSVRSLSRSLANKQPSFSAL
jgi:hypothetical protein